MKGDKNMKKWEIVCSIDGDLVDYSEIVESEKEPEFWEQYAIAEKHGCEWFTCDELGDK